MLESLVKDGFARVWVDGEIRDLDEDIDLDRKKRHSIAVVVDRIILKPDSEKRLFDSIETALKLSGGLVAIKNMETGEDLLMNENFACVDCGISIEELSPRMFSFNSPFGACPDCTGLGMIMKK